MKKLIKNNKSAYSYLLFLNHLLLKKKAVKNRKANVFMPHIGRVGSTVLADLLNQHSQIHWDGEFYPKQNERYLKIISENPIKLLEIKMTQNITDYYGFELKSLEKQLYGKNAVNQNFDLFLKNIEKLNFNHFILLERKNYLKQFISYKFAKKTKIHHIKKDTKNINTLEVNPQKSLWFGKYKTLFKHFEYLDSFYENTKNILKQKKTLFLTYEDDILQNPIIAYKKVCDFLNIENQNPKVNLKRTNPYPLSDIIENYDEMEQYFKNTKYEWMLYK